MHHLFATKLNIEHLGPDADYEETQIVAELEWTSVGKPHRKINIYYLLGHEEEDMGISGNGGTHLVSAETFNEALKKAGPDENIVDFLRSCIAENSALYVNFL